MLKLELKNIFDCDDVIFIIQTGMTDCKIPREMHKPCFCASKLAIKL